MLERLQPSQTVYQRFAHSHFFYFYSGYSYEHWLCREPFEKRLKLCIEVFSKSTNREIRNNYRLMSGIGVEYECGIRTLFYLKPIETSMEIHFLGRGAKPEMGLTIDMYKCPLTKMDIVFKGKENPPEIYDFYITIGRSLVTVAMLRDSPSGKNICLKDEFYYPQENKTYRPTSVMGKHEYY